MAGGVRVDIKKSLKTRLFCVVPKKSTPKATQRNKLKRWCREAWRAAGLTQSKTTTTIRVHGKETFSDIKESVYAAAKQHSQLEERKN